MFDVSCYKHIPVSFKISYYGLRMQIALWLGGVHDRESKRGGLRAATETEPTDGPSGQPG